MKKKAYKTVKEAWSTPTHTLTSESPNETPCLIHQETKVPHYPPRLSSIYVALWGHMSLVQCCSVPLIDIDKKNVVGMKACGTFIMASFFGGGTDYYNVCRHLNSVLGIILAHLPFLREGPSACSARRAPIAGESVVRKREGVLIVGGRSALCIANGPPLP